MKPKMPKMSRVITWQGGDILRWEKGKSIYQVEIVQQLDSFEPIRDFVTRCTGGKRFQHRLDKSPALRFDMMDAWNAAGGAEALKLAHESFRVARERSNEAAAEIAAREKIREHVAEAMPEITALRRIAQLAGDPSTSVYTRLYGILGIVNETLKPLDISQTHTQKGS